ncbi:nibrin isoform X2 [Dendrobates tinctorius]|uniref:nibrin isoform X2 n=1 Tax=Dendrobates tinctorius TaxID=92724 RepID=UPI003CC964B0
MWRLERESAGALTYHFLTGTDYIVGRKNCAILIGDDQSISRAHATFSVSRPLSSLGQPDIIPTLTIKDSSKYGTFINEEKMEIGSSRPLKSGDKITFGVYNSTFRVIYEPLVACSSCLNGAEKSSLTQDVLLLGGHIVNNWTPLCTHLVMTSVKVTIKTLCALVCGRSIIKPEYFTELIKAIKQKTPLPTPASFFPIIDEPSLQSESLDFSENKKRRTVFIDKTVVFVTAKQHKKLSAAIHLGGGKTELLTGEVDDTSFLENPNVCVIDVGFSESQSSESQDFPPWITSIVEILHSKGLRTVPEAEIGLAVIYMSTEKYCNPRQGSANKDEAEKNGRHNIMVSTQSSSMAVDETVLPPATFNTTAYVANTEPQDQTENWMEISGDREVKETPKSHRRSSKTDPRKNLDVESDRSDCRIALFQEQLQERPRAASQAGTPASDRHRVSQKIESSNKIQDYFQPVSKKREREEENGETSATKLCRTENVTSQSSQSTKEIVPPNHKNAHGARSNAPDTELHTEPTAPSTDRLGNSYGRDKMDTFMTSQPKDSFMRKRKETEDVVEESDVENEDCEDGKNTKSNGSQMKRPRVATTEDFGEGFSINSQDRGERAAIPFRTKQENDDGLPSKLLVSEFRSLVVNRSSRNSQTMNKAHQENVANFKKFRKVAYPGAGSFPHIIGGSDLIAHDRKKNSELEQWLRQEMEEQTQQAREQSLADDLFRYNPRMVKKRR